jgi:hypothetical protein
LPFAVKAGAVIGVGVVWTPSTPTVENVDSGIELSALTIDASAEPDGLVAVFFPPPTRRMMTRPPTTAMTTTTAAIASSRRRRRSARCWAASCAAIRSRAAAFCSTRLAMTLLH